MMLKWNGLLQAFWNNKPGVSIFSTSPPTGGKLKWVTLERVNEWSGRGWAVSWRGTRTVSSRWSSPDHTRGCGRRRRIWCNTPWASPGPGRWPGRSSSGRYLWRTPLAYPQGSLAPHLASCLPAAGVCSLQDENSQTNDRYRSMLFLLLDTYKVNHRLKGQQRLPTRIAA